MELYVLNSELKRAQVVDMFESCIWAERYAEVGDFQLSVISTMGNRNLFVADRLLACDRSNRVMIVKDVESSVNEDGRAVLNIKGMSYEDVLKERLAKQTMDGLTTDPDWVITGTPIEIAKEVFKAICIDGTLSAADIIPYIVEGDLTATPGSWYAMDPELVWDDADGEWDDAYAGYEAPGAPDLFEDITVTFKPMSVYQVVKDLIDIYGLGFRIVRNGDQSELYFEVYQGLDRTSLQEGLPPVVFSVSLENLRGITEFDSVTDSKNVAYVFSPNGSEIVYAYGADENTVGADRRVLFVDANDIADAAGPGLDLKLQQRGLLELAKVRKTQALDGEITQFGAYQYGVDFNLGDIVEMSSADGSINKMRVTEQIFVHDGEGERSYPTLVSDLLVDPGSWYSVPPSVEWDEADGVWADA